MEAPGLGTGREAGSCSPALMTSRVLISSLLSFSTCQAGTTALPPAASRAGCGRFPARSPRPPRRPRRCPGAQVGQRRAAAHGLLRPRFGADFPWMEASDDDSCFCKAGPAEHQTGLASREARTRRAKVESGQRETSPHLGISLGCGEGGSLGPSLCQFRC